MSIDADFFKPFLNTVKYTMDNLYKTDRVTFTMLWDEANGSNREIPQRTIRMLQAQRLFDITGKILCPVRRAIKTLYPDRPVLEAPPRNLPFTMDLPDGSDILSSNYFTIGSKLTELQKEPELFNQLVDAIKSGEILSEPQLLGRRLTDAEGKVLPAVKSVYDCVFVRGRTLLS
jgi:hypothetical protein